MSAVISCFLGWSGNILIVSGILAAFYFLLRKLNIKSESRYVFLKLSFIALPLLPFIFLEGFKLFQSLALTSGAGSSQSGGSAIFLNSNGMALATSNQDFKLLGWALVALFLIYVLSVTRGLIRIFYSAWTIKSIKRSSIIKHLENGHRVFIHKYPLAPAATGIFNPVILIPKKLLAEVSDKELNLIVQHEAIHLKRLDPLFNALRLIAKEILIFSPFVHWLSQAFEEEMELSVDEALIQNRELERKSYGALLLRICSQEDQSLAVMCNGLFKSSSFIKRRIENMKNSSQRPARRKLVAGLFIGFFVSAAITVPAIGLAEKSKVNVPIGSSNQADVAKYCSEGACSKEFKDTLVEAEKGNIEAQNKVGVMLHFAEGVKQNYAEALKWYLRAIEKQHAEAANHIGRIYLNGEGVLKNAAEACKWYIKSGDWGHAWGMMNAASCYKNAHGSFVTDETKSAEWYQRAEKAQPGILKEYEKKLAEIKK